MVNYRDILNQGARQPPAADNGTINTNIDAAYHIYNDGPILMFGDTHGTPDGHQAFIAMMDTMQRAHVTTLAIELPTGFNDWLKKLQNDIKTKHLTPEQVQAEVREQFHRVGMEATGGDQTINDIGSVIYAATQHNMKVTGVDDRETSEDFVKRLTKAIESGDRQQVSDVLFSSDPAIADRIAQIARHLPPGEKMAVLFGVEHGCSNERQPRIVDRLRQHGFEVRPISLDDQTTSYVAGECRNPPTEHVNAPDYISSVTNPEPQEQRQRQRRHPPHLNKELARQSPSFTPAGT